MFWDIATARPGLARVDHTSDVLYPLSFTPGDGVVTFRQSGSATRLLDDASGKQLAIVPGDIEEDPRTAGIKTAYSAAGLVAVADPITGGVVVAGAASGHVVARLTPPPVTSPDANMGFPRLAFSPDGTTLAVLPTFGPAWLWHVPVTARR
jgi:hypothetical protein